MSQEIIINHVVKKLKKKGYNFEDGLSQHELNQVETLFGFVFPPDLRHLLSTQLPASDSFVNWRLTLTSPAYKNEIDQRLAWPKKGLLFSVKSGYFWMDDWGNKPTTFEEQKAIVETAFENYPRMIPIYSHRYIPETPSESGNSVFSVHQADTIYYGNDLWSYLAHEFTFQLPGETEKPTEPKRIRFWSKLVDLNNSYFNQ